jgi:hypothetical protein
MRVLANVERKTALGEQQVPRGFVSRELIVATLLFGELPYFRYTQAINRLYCRRHGYSYKIIRPPRQVQRCPIWFKVSGVAALLPSANFVLFMDADAYFVDHAKSLESLIHEQMEGATLLIGTDRRDETFAWSDSDANTGVFLIRRAEEAFGILADWWDAPLKYDKKWLWAWPPEQAAFNRYVRTGRYADRIKVVRYSYMNGADGPFIRHLVAVSDHKRLALLRDAARCFL